MFGKGNAIPTESRSRALRWILSGVWSLVTLGLPMAGWAHHSFAMFDSSQCRVVTGTVRTFEWNFPHSWIWVVVVADSQSTETVWGFEGDSPVLLSRDGWKRDSLKPGDKVTVRFAPLRDGKPGGAYGLVTLPNGTDLKGTVNASKCWTDPAASASH